VRTVLDTNIIVSALLGPSGPPGRTLRFLRRAPAYRLVTSPAQIDELSRVLLTYPRITKRIRPEQAQSFLDGLPLLADVVDDLPEVNISPDPDDNAIIATAIAGKADVIVSGDKRHMVSLGEAAGIPILTARQFIESLGEQEKRGDA